MVAGSALVPVTAVTLLLSGASGRLAARSGPRPPLVAGCLLCTVASMLAVRIGPYADPEQFRFSFAQISWICAAAFACAALLSATFITGPRRRTPARRLALIQTPVPHLACPVALRHTPRQTRKPDSSQTSNPSCATDTPSPSRPRIDHAQAEA